MLKDKGTSEGYSPKTFLAPDIMAMQAHKELIDKDQFKFVKEQSAFYKDAGVSLPARHRFLSMREKYKHAEALSNVLVENDQVSPDEVVISFSPEV